MSHRIGIIAALSGELKPLVSDWSPQPDGAFLTQRGDVALIAVAKGIGIVRAEQAVSIAETYGSLNALVSIGWAGGASCGVQPGMAYEVGEVIDPASGERYATSAVASPIKLVTLDHVAGREEKRKVAESYGASLVDMEAVRMGRKKMFASSTKAERELGFRIVPVYAALRTAIDWFRAHGYAPAT